MKAASSRGSAKTGKAEKTRERLLSAAVEEFSAWGFDGARVDRIAEKAGTNKERIYAYFGGKDGLFSAALERVYSLLVAEDEAILDLGETDLGNLSDRLLRRYFLFHDRHPEFRRLLAWENLSEADHGAFIRGMRKEAFEHLRTLFAAGKKKSRFARGFSFETYLFVLSAVSFFFFSNKRTMKETLGENLDDPAVRERILREVGFLFQTER